MTRKDYLALAAALKAVKPEVSWRLTQFELCCKAIATVCERENPRGFDRAQFLTNCGIEQEKTK